MGKDLEKNLVSMEYDVPKFKDCALRRNLWLKIAILALIVVVVGLATLFFIVNGTSTYSSTTVLMYCGVLLITIITLVGLFTILYRIILSETAEIEKVLDKKLALYQEANMAIISIGKKEHEGNKG